MQRRLIAALFFLAAATAGAQSLIEVTDVPGGLCALLNTDDAALFDTFRCGGRFIVHGVHPDAQAVASVRDTLIAKDLYGLAWIETGALDTLPYTENLVNVVAVEHWQGSPSLEEIQRVLAPLGAVLLDVEASPCASAKRVHIAERAWWLIRKPYPEAMDTWPMPRHSASNNTVSSDALVGPPRRVRWVTGPMKEWGNVISAGGRNYYGGVIARDAFNGMRLWQYALSPSPQQGGATFWQSPGAVQYVASDKYLFVMSNDLVRALDGATGEEVRTFPEAGLPRELIYAEGRLITVDHRSIRAFNPDTGEMLWKVLTNNPACISIGAGALFHVEGNARRGEYMAIHRLDLETGNRMWRVQPHNLNPDTVKAFEFAARASWCVYYKGLLAFEISTYSDASDVSLVVLSADTGERLWDYAYKVSMAHVRQARVMFQDDRAWILEGHQWVALDARTGEQVDTMPGGYTHCFPPVSTQHYFMFGEMCLTNVQTRQRDENRITKMACGHYVGAVPANGLINATPKHCVCWPMLKGFCALAPAKGADVDPYSGIRCIPETGPAAPAVLTDSTPSSQDWPIYRGNAVRSGSHTASLPTEVTVKWATQLGGPREGFVTHDWRENPFCSEPLTPPVIADGLVVVAQPDRHCVVACATDDGEVQWRFTADGRVDSAPTLYRGLCLFGTRSGSVYALRAADGVMVWRLPLGAHKERIMSHGQLESPWPVPGSVLLYQGLAYAVAGRQYAADGGIHVVALDPATGTIQWTQRITDMPDHNYYAGNSLEFDNIDLLTREENKIVMSRWKFEPHTGDVELAKTSGFGYFRTGDRGVMAPRNLWTYGPRTGDHKGHRALKRPLGVFIENQYYGCDLDKRRIYRRDFNIENGEVFDTEWWNKRIVSQELGKEDGVVYRTDRLMEKTSWLADVTPDAEISAMVLAGTRVYACDTSGKLHVLDADSGELLFTATVTSPVWDGLAAAGAYLFLSGSDGSLMCLASKAL